MLGTIHIQRFKDGHADVGKYIEIYGNGTIYIGEYYYDTNGLLKDRYTIYYEDGLTGRIGY